ncbi:hypothetical protein Pa4123_49410 [Phytohabitans aurantiacus]|uniref:histidine kinase n=1 Tax=Phytohabitans aurantiacus TaxID=3016789 RepID=A0ABQ5QZE8_9ACTN|nr:hypothetical protein Pa4123_49410 [Phytohabitans aurantiacus]
MAGRADPVRAIFAGYGSTVRPRWREAPLPAALAVLQALWWPLVPGWLGEPADGTAIALAAAGTAVACAALLWRRIAPGPALVATLAAAVPLGAGLGERAPFGFVAAAFAFLALATHRTAGVAALGGLGTVVALTATVALRGGSPRALIGYALIAVAGAAAGWVWGRSRRRRRTDAAAVAVFDAEAPAIALYAAAGERRRLAAELHDVAAHRLTGIVVSAAAAHRLGDPELVAEAGRHAIEAGRQALAELDRLADLDEDVPAGGLDDVDTLVAERPEVTYTRTGGAGPVEAGALAYRVVREALTNTARYAGGAPVSVRIAADAERLAVTVADSGGTPAAAGVGSGGGLAGLREAVRAAGGTFDAGPEGTGWTVRAVLPATAPAPGRRPAWRGPAALDWALTVLAIALPLGAGLLPGSSPDPLSHPDPGTALLMLLLVLFAAPLRWRRLAPMRAVLANLAALLAWLGAEVAGWTPAEGTDLLGWTLWAQLVLAYSVGAYRTRRGWPAPLAIAAVDGFVFVSGLTGDVVAGWVIFSTVLAGPALLAWAIGILVRARRRRIAARRATVEADAVAAVETERRRIAAGLRVTARRHAEAVVDAAEAGRLSDVLTEARAGLAAMRELLTELRAGGIDAGHEPPPTIAGVAVLAARRRATVRYSGSRRAIAPEMEVAAYRLADLMLRADGTLTVTYLVDGVRLTAPRPDGVEVRRLRALADAAGGAVTAAAADSTSVWLPG